MYAVTAKQVQMYHFVKLNKFFTAKVFVFL